MRRRQAVCWVAVLVAVSACAYDAPWGPGQYGPNGPFDPNSPGRVTISAGVDRTPAWLGDTAVLYSVERADRADDDRCLGVLSARTWTLERWLCHLPAPSLDSTDAFEWPAVGPGGRLAYQWAVWAIGGARPERRALVVATLGRWDASRTVVQFLPYGIIGADVDGAADVRWLADTALVYRRETMSVTMAPLTRILDTTVTPVDLEEVDFGGATPAVTVIAGTAGATSLDLDPAARALYYTLSGDSTVYRRQLDSGAVSVVHAFAGGAVSGVQVRGTRLVAVVGGVLHVVDLGSGADVSIGVAGLTFAHPALSPDGHTVIMEGTPPSAPDLWRVILP